MFEFGIINTADGNQIIDMNTRTPYSALSPVQMMEYMEIAENLLVMDKLQRTARREAESQRKNKGSLFYRMVAMCGLL